MSKTRTSPEGQPADALGGGGSGYLWRRRTPVNRSFRTFVPHPTFARKANLRAENKLVANDNRSAGGRASVYA